MVRVIHAKERRLKNQNNSQIRCYRIETQDALFSGPKNVERYIEVGPANILGTMAKRTIASKYAASDRFSSLERQILSFADNMKEIYAIYPEEAEALAEAPSTAKPKPAPPSSPDSQSSGTPQSSVEPLPAPSASSVAVEIPDMDISPEHIIRSVVANKLKKVFEDVQVEKSIKDLSSGEYAGWRSWFRMLIHVQFRQIHAAE